MGREVRKVPKGWEHPKDKDGRYVPLMSGYSRDRKEFMELLNKEGLQKAIDYCGSAPDKQDYMPEWPESEATQWVMYENTSEGTPISPAFDSPEDLARWLADNKASAFAEFTASYDEWLKMINRGWAPSAVISNGVMESGVSHDPSATQPR